MPPTRLLVMSLGITLLGPAAQPLLAQQPSATPPAEITTEPSTELPDGFDILERSAEVTGASTRGLKLEGIRLVGTIVFPKLNNLKGTVEVCRAAPASSRTVADIPGMGQAVSGTHGDKAWAAAMPGQQPELVEGEQARAMIEEAELHLGFQPHKKFSRAACTGTETINGEPCYRVELVTARTGTESTSFFAVDSARLVRQVNQTPTGPQIIDWSEYREIDGLWQPTRMRITMGNHEQIITFDTVELDPDFAPGTFDAPGDV